MAHLLPWLIIKIIWEPSSLRRSHWWMWLKNWVPALVPDQIPVVSLPADPKAKNRQGFWKNLIKTNFIWSKTAVLALLDKTDSEYQLGYIQKTLNGLDIRFCTLVLKGETAVLLGNQPVDFFARKLDGEFVLLRVVETGNSKWNISGKRTITII